MSLPNLIPSLQSSKATNIFYSKLGAKPEPLTLTMRFVYIWASLAATATAMPRGENQQVSIQMSCLKLLVPRLM